MPASTSTPATGRTSSRTSASSSPSPIRTTTRRSRSGRRRWPTAGMPAARPASTIPSGPRSGPRSRADDRLLTWRAAEPREGFRRLAAETGPSFPPARRAHEHRTHAPRNEPGDPATPPDGALSTPVRAGPAPARPAGGLVRRDLPGVAGDPLRLGVLVPRPSHVGDQARLHARQLPAARRQLRLPDGCAAHDRRRGDRHGARHRPRVPDRVLHGARRERAPARRALRARAAAAVDQLSGPRLRLARDPRQGRPPRLVLRTDRAARRLAWL